ncbi:MAG: hypothetical protein J0M18_17015 [Ignavibacteria bacterium]|nr:hypothetical protein [Ignavibacteria bacterium]
MEKNIKDLYEQILKSQGIELVSITDGSTAEPNPEDFSSEITQRTLVLFKKGDSEFTETFYSSDPVSIEKTMKQVQLEFALKS